MSRTRRSHQSLVCLLVLFSWFTILAAGGCRYPRISADAYELAKAMSNLCNARNTAQLEMARSILRERHEAGRISTRERRYLDQIAELAEQERWGEAERKARQMLRDQTDW